MSEFSYSGAKYEGLELALFRQRGAFITMLLFRIKMCLGLKE